MNILKFLGSTEILLFNFFIIIKVIIEKTDYYNVKNQSPPLDMLIQSKSNASSVYSNSFLKQIKENASILSVGELSCDSFKTLCERNDPDLFDVIIKKSKFNSDLYATTTTLFDCAQDFINRGENLNLKLIKSLLDFISDKEQSSGKMLFSILNKIIELSINRENYSLAEFALGYFDERVHREPYPFRIDENGQYRPNINKHLITHATFKKLNEARAWKLIEKILNCSNLSSGTEEIFCFSYLDFTGLAEETNQADTGSALSVSNPNNNVIAVSDDENMSLINSSGTCDQSKDSNQNRYRHL